MIVVALAGLGLSAVAARRTPRAAASAALTAHAATVVLAALACCPLPAWWAWENKLPAADAPAAAGFNGIAVQDPSVAEQSAASTADGVSIFSLLPLLNALGRRTPNAEPSTVVKAAWPTVVLAVVVAGTALGLIRLLLGLWAVRRGYRRSRPVGNGDLLRLVSELCATLGVRRRVVLRETDDVATAATR